MSESNVGPATERRSGRPAKRIAAKAPVLPSARAAVGALLCVLAALLTFVAYRQAQLPPTTKYLVAVHEMKPGAPLLPADFREEAITLPPQVAARSFTSFTQLQNAFLLGPIQQGELLQASNLANRSGGAGSFEWSFPIESIRAAGGFLRVGERIQILGTVSRDGQAVTEIINPSALIIAMDRSDPNPFRGSLSILLALNSQAEVFRMQNALDNQKLTVVRGVDPAAQKSVKASEPEPTEIAKTGNTPLASPTGSPVNPDSPVPAGAATTPDPDPASDPSPAPTNPVNPS